MAHVALILWTIALIVTVGLSTRGAMFVMGAMKTGRMGKAEGRALIAAWLALMVVVYFVARWRGILPAQGTVSGE